MEKNISKVKLVNLKEKLRKLNVRWTFNMNCNFFADKFIFTMIIWHKTMIHVYTNWPIVVYYVKVTRKKLLIAKIFFSGTLVVHFSYFFTRTWIWVNQQLCEQLLYKRRNRISCQIRNVQQQVSRIMMVCNLSIKWDVIGFRIVCLKCL